MSQPPSARICSSCFAAIAIVVTTYGSFFGANAIVLAKPPVTAPLLTLSDQSLVASIVSITDSGVTFQTGDSDQDLAFDEFVQWGAVVENRHDAQIFFAGGGILVADVISVKDGWLRADSPTWGQMKIPLRMIQGVLLQPSWRAEEFDQLYFKIREYALKSDRIELTGGDALSGVLLEFHAVDGYEYKEGKIRLRLSETDDVIEGADDRVRALLFNSSLTRKPAFSATNVWYGWKDGSLLPVASIKTTSGLVELTLQSGMAISTDQQTFYKKLAYLGPDNQQVTWLSDLPPLAYKHTPFLNQPWPLKIDRNVQGGRLRSSVGVHPKGIGMHSRSRVAFKTDGAKRFQAEVALDAVAGAKGSAVFRLYANRDGGWSPAWQSELIHGSDAPTSVDLSVADANAILLIVDFGDRGDVGDCANWLNARFIAE